MNQPGSADLHLVRYANGYRPICGGCGWDDAPHATRSGAEVAFEQHRCGPSQEIPHNDAGAE